VLKENQARPVTAGIDRTIRWTGSADNTTTMTAGNAANAAAITKGNVKKVRHIHCISPVATC
jgi:hypothetical protein